MKSLKKIWVFILAASILSACVFAESSGFSDVNEGAWFYENVTKMTQLGLLKGYPDGSFRPDNKISAAEFVTLVARVGGLEPSQAQNSHWAGPLLQTALDRGWYDWDELPPTAESYEDPIVRQVAVKIVMKAFAPEVRGDYSTESAKINDFSQLDGRYYEGVLAAYSKGVVEGNDKGNFCPRDGITRAEACALITRAMDKLDVTTGVTTPTPPPTPTPTPSVPVTTKRGVSENGHLQVIGTQLCNEAGEAVVLRGMSSHGIQWFPQFLSGDIIKSTSDRGANLFRVAMYTDEGGYISNPSMKQRLIDTVDTAIGLDMYAIIDWHILHDGDPNTYKEQAKAFFTEMAQRYKDNPAVIYEICNEPNGNVSWSKDVKPYAEEIIEAIRAIDPSAIILVGSPTWSQDLHEAAKDPIKADNIMYTCHFYAGTHTAWLRDRISSAMQQGLPVFVSEWGTSDASGSGGVYLDEAQRWMDFMNQNNISWANWSLCDKNESSAAIKPSADVSKGIADDDLSESGKFVFSHFED